MLSLSLAQFRALRIAAALILILLLSGLFIGGAQPQAVGLFPAPWDKGVHLVFFAGVAVLISSALGGLQQAGRAVWLIAILATIVIGAADEWHQTLLPGRQAGLDDLFCDAIGAVLGASGILWARSRLYKKSP